MIDLIIRADDVGYSEAVNYGIEKTVKQGLIGSVGLMPNMPAAAHGLACWKAPASASASTPISALAVPAPTRLPFPACWTKTAC